ncbi:uncharacterized protein DEA37_0007945 [Paragonimus westermani]|uniref:Uncharacterized protein n=1 Tax=Paragonimus westermani TaxID=34504 RepID=A0A5J4NWW7_9TREM|nr:uncharacterized protein DEA37_0007945 [Paragonimus westermani]
MSIGVLLISSLNLQVDSVCALSRRGVHLHQLLPEMIVLAKSEVVLCILFGVYGAVLFDVEAAVLTTRYVDLSDSAVVTVGTATPSENVPTETHDAGKKFTMLSSAMDHVHVSGEVQTHPPDGATEGQTNPVVTTSKKPSKVSVTAPSASMLKHTSPDLSGLAFIDGVDVPNAASVSNTSSGDSERTTNSVTSTKITTGFPHLMSTLSAFSVEVNHGSKTGRNMDSQEQLAAVEEFFRKTRPNTGDVDAVGNAHSHHSSVIKPVSADVPAVDVPVPKKAPASAPEASSKDEKGLAIQLSPTLIFSSFACLLVRLVPPN